MAHLCKFYEDIYSIHRPYLSRLPTPGSLLDVADDVLSHDVTKAAANQRRRSSHASYRPLGVMTAVSKSWRWRGLSQKSATRGLRSDLMRESTANSVTIAHCPYFVMCVFRPTLTQHSAALALWRFACLMQARITVDVGPSTAQPYAPPSLTCRPTTQKISM